MDITESAHGLDETPHVASNEVHKNVDIIESKNCSDNALSRYECVVTFVNAYWDNVDWWNEALKRVHASEVDKWTECIESDVDEDTAAEVKLMCMNSELPSKQKVFFVVVPDKYCAPSPQDERQVGFGVKDYGEMDLHKVVDDILIQLSQSDINTVVFPVLQSDDECSVHPAVLVPAIFQKFIKTNISLQVIHLMVTSDDVLQTTRKVLQDCNDAAEKLVSGMATNQQNFGLVTDASNIENEQAIGMQTAPSDLPDIFRTEDDQSERSITPDIENCPQEKDVHEHPCTDTENDKCLQTSEESKDQTTDDLMGDTMETQPKDHTTDDLIGATIETQPTDHATEDLMGASLETQTKDHMTDDLIGTNTEARLEDIHLTDAKADTQEEITPGTGSEDTDEEGSFSNAFGYPADGTENAEEHDKEASNKLFNPWKKKSVKFSDNVQELRVGENPSTDAKFTRSSSTESSGDEEGLDYCNNFLGDHPPQPTQPSQELHQPYQTEPHGRGGGRGRGGGGYRGGRSQNPRRTHPNFTCPICKDEHSGQNRMMLEKCGHIFCIPCISRQLEDKGTCPLCNTRYRARSGTMPEGLMWHQEERTSLPGFPGYGTIVLEYQFADGIQTSEHPSPGTPYKGIHRIAYLPASPDGRRIFQLLENAFNQRLTFVIGRSITRGVDNVITWNDIHHKTRRDGGPERFGYPDPRYLRRVYDELSAKGVTEDSDDDE